MDPIRKIRDEYTVGWIAALATEQAAAVAMLDEQHERPYDFEQSSLDKNSYTWGRIADHNIVIAVLPAGGVGMTSAATTAQQMLFAFPQIRIGLMVGIGGGIPRPDDDVDIRLGDIVVSQPSGTHGGVVQYDLGKMHAGGRIERKGSLNSPPRVLLTALEHLKAQHMLSSPLVPRTMERMLDRYPRMRKTKPSYAHPGPSHDRLFKSSYHHAGGKTCSNCKDSERVQREEREDLEPEIHYGIIASGNTVVKDADSRDRIMRDIGQECLCFEMEAAGLMSDFPCLVIRGISDYSDSHKNDRWHGYAAAAAAAYAKELLTVMPPSELKREKTAIQLARVDSNVTQIKEMTTDVHRNVVSLSSENRQRRIRSWLSPPDPSKNLRAALCVRSSGSGQWLLRCSAFSAWKATPRSFLWLNGKAGCGKSVLSSTVIDHLQQESQGISPSPILLYFYFDFSDRRKQSLKEALLSLVDQLYRQSPDTHAALDELFSSCQDGNHEPTIIQLKETFQEMMRQCKAVFLIIDALDECHWKQGSQNDPLHWIRSLRQEQKTLCFMVTSRPEQQIESSIRSWSRMSDIISLQNNSVNKDIAKHIRVRVRDHEGLSRWRQRPEVQEEIESALLEKADGMFRWVTCQLDALEQCLDYPSLQTALSQLPEDLDETYSRILERLPQAHRNHTVRILQFLSFSEHPLRMGEIVDAVATDLSLEPAFDAANRMPKPEEVARYCSSLITVIGDEDGGIHGIWRLDPDANSDENLTQSSDQSLHDLSDGSCIPSLDESLCSFSDDSSDDSSYDLSDDSSDQNNERESDAFSSYRLECAKYKLAHFSVKEWLLSDRLGTEMAPMFEEIEAKATIAKVCIAYLLSLDHQLSRKEIRSRFFLARFSARHWARYAAGVQASDATVNEMVMKLFTRHRSFEVCYRTRHPDPYWSDKGEISALYYAASFGLSHAALELLDLGADIDARGGHHGTALHAAAANGHREVVELLLTRGADVNAQYGYHGTETDAAAVNIHPGVVELPLDGGADGEFPADCFSTVLQAAAAHGHGEVIELLLDRGADIKARSGYYGTALQAAASNGQLEMVELLIDRGGEIDSLGGYYGTVLQAAAAGGYRGHLKIVKFLLDRGADVNALGGYYGTALQAAAAGGYRGHREVVELLLDRGADINSVGGYYGTALQAAAAGVLRGSREVVKLLLDRGADINSLSGYYGTALQAAAGHGRHDRLSCETVKLLLDRGADINAKGGCYGTALQAAITNGHPLVREVLVKRVLVNRTRSGS